MLRQWKTSLIPTYGVYRLYDNYIVEKINTDQLLLVLDLTIVTVPVRFPFLPNLSGGCNTFFVEPFIASTTGYHVSSLLCSTFAVYVNFLLSRFLFTVLKGNGALLLSLNIEGDAISLTSRKGDYSDLGLHIELLQMPKQEAHNHTHLPGFAH